MQMEETVQKPHVLAPTEVHPNNSYVNILLLGPTGVGKSTFINALYNYVSYASLEDALEGPVLSLIYSRFTSSVVVGDDDEYVSRTITVGKRDDSERAPDDNPLSSGTQSCKAYVFPFDESLKIRLIDTPGIGDTRGGAMDEDNLAKTLSFLSNYDVLHAVCILLKPNEVRLTTSLKYSIIKLLERLHKDASANILFCFTNSSITNFKPGDTLDVLKSMLYPKPGSSDSIKLNIGLKPSTMYFFDSKAFRFQAMKAHGMAFTDREKEEHKISWEASNMEAGRLITHIRSLEPHRIKDTLSLNRVRSMLESIQKPLGMITASIQKNLQEITNAKSFVKDNQGAIAHYVERLFIEQEFQESVPLQHPRTVCNQPSCKDKICHDHCSSVEKVLVKAGSRVASVAKSIGDFGVPLAGAVVNAIGEYLSNSDKWILCSRLSLITGCCSFCSCPNDKHIRTHHEMRTVTRKVEDEEIRRVLQAASTEGKKKADLLEIYESKERSLKDEREVVHQAALHFAAFLEENSIVTYHSAVPHYYEEQIKLMLSQGKQAKAAELDAVLKLYRKQADEFKQCLYKSKDPNFDGSGLVTERVVEEHLQRLYNLPVHGPSLKAWIDGIENLYTVASGRGEVVCNIPVARTDHAATATDSSRPTGLRGMFTRARKPNARG